MPVIFFHRTLESTEFTVLTHIGVWVKPINTLYPDANLTSLNTNFEMMFPNDRVDISGKVVEEIKPVNKS